MINLYSLTAAILPLLLGAASLAGQSLPLRTDVPPVAWDGCPAANAVAVTVADASRTEAERLAADATEAALLGEAAAALEMLTRAAGLDPRSSRIAFLRARSLDAAGQTDAAMAEYCRYLGLAPTAADGGEIRQRLDELAARRGFAVPAAAAAAFGSGVEQYAAGDFAAAAASFGAAAAAAPDWRDAIYNRGVAQLAAGATDEAAQDLRRYLEVSPGAPDFTAVLETLARLQVMPVVSQRHNPQAALVSGLLVPGLGQLTTGRTGAGMLVFGTAAGMVGAGILLSTSEVECLAPPVGGVCPAGQVLRETTNRPLLVPAVAAAAVTGIIGALEARRGARRLNEAAVESRPANARRSGLSPAAPYLDTGAGGSIRLALIRFRF